jgi:methylamine dehydrogenase heavy chain
MTTGRGVLCAAALLATTTLSASAAMAPPARDDLDPGAKLAVAESHVTAVLSPTHARRVFVSDTAFPAAEAARTYIVDGSSGRLEGMLPQGYWPNFAVSPDGAFLYSADTYFEKHTRGKRSDYVVVRDARTLTVLDDIPLPTGRLLIVSKKYNFGVTPDGHYGLSFNLAPRTALSVVDLRARKYVGDIDIPGCGLVFPQAPNRFTSVCADGSVVTVTFDEQLQASREHLRRVFDAESDPVFEHAGWDGPDHRLYLVSYSGLVHPLDLSGAVAVKLPAWQLATEEERAEGWKPGGWQVAHFHAPTQRLYVLMHQGHEWTHKQSGTEVWVFDAPSGRRLQRIALAQPVQSIAVSQDAAPLLYTLPEEPEIQVYEAASGKLLHTLDKLGFSPTFLTVPGE